jgi:phospholipase C
MRMRRNWLAPMLVLAIVLAGVAVLASVGSGRSVSNWKVCRHTKHPTLCCRQHGGCVTSVTMRATPNPSNEGGTVTVSGRVVGLGVTGIPVVLWQRPPQARGFSSVATASTGRGGYYTLVGPLGSVTTNRDWYVVAGGIQGRTLHQRVRTLITLTASSNDPDAGDPDTLGGTVSPPHAGQQVRIQQFSGGAWRQLVTAELDKTSSFEVLHAFGVAGTAKLRAYVGGTIRNVGSSSQPLTLRVAPGPQGIHKIQHVVIIMQENRSFDEYFGTYPGADGIPAGVCEPDPTTGTCIAPYHDPQDLNFGGPHGAPNATADIDGGNMDGFIAQAEKGKNCSTTDPSCSPCTDASQSQCIDVMGYHDGADIPNYWDYARNYVLQDQMFESDASWSLPEHLYLVSGWSAYCTNPNNPDSCTNAIQSPNGAGSALSTTPLYAWTDITYLLHKYGISWGYYVFQGSEPDCDDAQDVTCAPVKQGPKTPGIWNPLPHFTDVRQDNQLANIQTLSNFFTATKAGTLPSVSWVIPNGTVSEHPPGLVSAGQTYVTGVINAIMQSPDWDSTAIFLDWDDWGGFYDSVDPPPVDENGYGLRTPGLVISPYARTGYIDHQVLSQDAYNKFIEDDFLGGQALDPATDGRPDPRPDVREDEPILGNLVNDFDFAQPPRPAMILPVCPQTDLVPAPACNAAADHP